MAKVKASELGAVDAEVIKEEANTLPSTKVEKTELSTVTATDLSGSGVEGDLDLDDIRMPRVNLMQKSSKLVDETDFQPGQILLAREAVIADRSKSVDVTVLHQKVQYQEKVEWGSDITPNVFNTKREVLAAGGSFEWGSDSYYQTIAHMTLLIRKPEHVDEQHDPLFPFHFKGEDYALALYTVSSSGYTSAGKEVNTAAQFYAKDGIWKLGWELSSELKKNSNNSWYVPILKRTGRHDAEFVEFVESLGAAAKNATVDEDVD